MQQIQTFFGNNQTFVLIITILFVLAGAALGHPTLAMWFGFGVASFSAVSNDSIQTLGTFLSSNRKVNWYWLWIFVGSIMLATIAFSWLSHGGDVSYGRLNKIPQPGEFNYIQLAAPIVLIVLTRFRMPVSTTFLILATFSSSKTIEGMLTKTFTGYLLAFFAALAVWGAVGYFIHRSKKDFKREMTKGHMKKWRILQWTSTGLLWSAWLSQDNANAVVFLPRDISLPQLLAVLAFMALMLGFVLYRRGGEIQKVVTEKTDVTYVKSATLIDFVYAIILIYFKFLNDLPMSTTWVFLGLLAGREIALRATLHKDKPYRHTLSLVGKDILRAGVGLAISLLLAVLASSLV